MTQVQHLILSNIINYFYSYQFLTQGKTIIDWEFNRLIKKNEENRSVTNKICELSVAL